MDVLEKAVFLWGKQSQITLAIEEMSELTKALCKYQRAGHPAWEKGDVQEEIADVEIMMKQLRVLFDELGSVDKIKTEKLERLEKIIKEASR